MAESLNQTLSPEFNSSPILIIGAPRSGTTLLTTMLNTHPNIFMANEAKVFVRILPQASKYPSPVTIRTANAIIDRLENQELHYLNPLPPASAILASRPAMDLATFIRVLFETLAKRENKNRWGEKTAVAYRELALICKSFPNARLLAVERNPYQMAASYIKINPKWGALGAVIHWLDFKRAIAKSVPDRSQILVISYEKLTNSPEKTLREVCIHIGEEFNSAMLDFHKTSRASTLASDKTYAGSAKPLYRSTGSPDYLKTGLQGSVIRLLIKSVAQIEHRPTFFYYLIKAWVYMRAAVISVKQKLLHDPHKT